MADTRTTEQRSRIMKSVSSRDTGPELTVRRLLHCLGYRYRLHHGELPGRPDIVFPGRRKAIFIHGCFWHGHGCGKGKLPKSRIEYWSAKINANRERDASVIARLEEASWQTLSVWQCELRNLNAIATLLREFLGPPRNSRLPLRSADTRAGTKRPTRAPALACPTSRDGLLTQCSHFVLIVFRLSRRESFGLRVIGVDANMEPSRRETVGKVAMREAPCTLTI